MKYEEFVDGERRIVEEPYIMLPLVGVNLDKFPAELEKIHYETLFAKMEYKFTNMFEKPNNK